MSNAKIHRSEVTLDPKAFGGAVQFGNPACQRVRWTKSGRSSYRVTSDEARITCDNCKADKHIDLNPVTYKGE